MFGSGAFGHEPFGNVSDTTVGPTGAGLSTETNTALALGSARPADIATETDAALALAAKQIQAVGLSTETETALALTGVSIKPVGLASETDTAFARSNGRVKWPIPIGTVSANGPDTVNVNYHPLCGSASSTNAEWNIAPRYSPIAAPGTLSNLVVRCPVALTVGSYTFILVVNGQDTLLTCTITSAGLIASDRTHYVNVVPGDQVTLRCIPSQVTVPAAQNNIQISMLFDGSTDAGNIFGGSVGSAVSGTPAYGTLGSFTANAGGPGPQTVTAPCDGTFTAIYTSVGNPPNPGFTRTATLVKNGVDTGLTATISDNDFTASLTGVPVSVVAGDRLYVRLDTTTITGSHHNYTFDFTPAIVGDFPMFGLVAASVSQTLQSFGQLTGKAGTGTAETALQVLAPSAFSIRGFFFQTTNAPGSAAKSRLAALRINGADTAATSNQVGASQLVSTPWSGSLAIAQDDLLSFGSTPTNTPVASGVITYATTGVLLDNVARYPAGLASGTSVAFALGSARPAGLTVETDTALALSAVQIKATGLATETETALPLAAVSITPVGLASETNAALALGALLIAPVGLANETSAAIALAAVAIQTAGLAEDSELALALEPVAVTSVGLATSAESALALGSARPVGAADESGEALALDVVLIAPVGLAQEVDTARALLSGVQNGEVGIANEDELALALGSARPAEVALEDSAAFALGSARPVGLAFEDDLARALSGSPRIGIAEETSTAFALVPATGEVIELPDEWSRVLELAAEERYRILPHEQPRSLVLPSGA